MKQNGLPKAERLSLKKDIEELFNKKNTDTISHFCYPLKSIMLPSEKSFSQIIISVPKRKFKKAVDRNRLKRLIKEAFRLNKNLLNSQFNIGFIYIADKLEDIKTIEKAVVTIIKKCNNL